jgi:small subunit ribosomal protein S6
MTRRYEMVYIFDSALDEEQVKTHLGRFHGLLISPDKPEPVTQSNHWGKRTLAYPIRGREAGYYVVEQFETEPKLLAEFERAVKLEPTVVRYLLVVNEGEGPRPPAPARAFGDSDDDAGEGDE